MRQQITKIGLIAATFVSSLTFASSNAYAQNARVQVVLNTMEQNLALLESNTQSMCDLSRAFKSDNNISCMGAKGNACIITAIHLATLQDLINQRLLQPRSPAYTRVFNYILRVRSDSECA
ncbi:hypothetical protein WA1_20705 [Scytonema hofmannii PCC 7110]|uniref:Uncharacterized protein n=1 Tax=Scytonema hofmannii PCC 7110 TaxID=128403 RepID=A0A139XCH0_9CYAN|nr:hypothetical protein [Scytonema hofmannii]KYC42391.1 hypothetical protein WA1_20705 [Scytonema hofmannii PCC 7110]